MRKPDQVPEALLTHRAEMGSLLLVTLSKGGSTMSAPQALASIITIVVSIGAPVKPSVAADWYAAPCADPPCGEGSFENPWDRQTALKPPRGTVQAGDTIWLRGGVYTPDPDYAAQACPGGNFCCELPGADGQPGVVHQDPGERA